MSLEGLNTVNILWLGLLLQYYTTTPVLFFLNTFFVQNVPASEAFLEKSFPSNVCKFEGDPHGAKAFVGISYIDVLYQLWY